MKRNVTRGLAFTAMLLAILMAWFIFPSANRRAWAAVSGGNAAQSSPRTQLDALEQTLETWLVLHGEAPKKFEDLLAFYTSENRLNPSAPRLAAGDWDYSTALAPDAWLDPTDPATKGIGWNSRRDEFKVSSLYPDITRLHSGSLAGWPIQARGLIIRLSHRGTPQLRLVKWLPVAEQVSLSEKGDSSQRLQILKAWTENVPAGAEGSPLLNAIRPALERLLEDANPEVSAAARRCVMSAFSQSLAPDRSFKDAPASAILPLLRKSVARIATPEERKFLVKTFYSLGNAEWVELTRAWAEDADPALRAAALDLYAAGWSEFDEINDRYRSRMDFWIPPEIFKRLIKDPDRRVQLAMLRFVGRQTSMIAGTPSHDYFGAGLFVSQERPIVSSPQQIILDLLHGQDAEAQREFLAAWNWGDYTYLQQVSEALPDRSEFPKIKADLQQSLERLADSLDPAVRRGAVRVLTGGSNWAPTTADLFMKFLKIGDPEDLAYLQRFSMVVGARVPWAAEAKKALAAALPKLTEEQLLGLCRNPFFSNNPNPWFFRQLEPDEQINLLERWSAAAAPQIRRMAVGQVASLLKPKVAHPEAAARRLESLKQKMLQDGDENVALEAARVFLSQDKDATLAWLGRSKDPVRSAVALELATAERPWLREELLRILERGNLSSRWQAAQRLAAFGERDRVQAFWQSLQPRPKAQGLYGDFRAMRRAVEAYYIDQSMFPPEPKCLTTPIPYLPVFPSDPFKKPGQPAFALHQLDPAKRGRFWILQGVGPDGRDDLAPHLDPLRAAAVARGNFSEEIVRQTFPWTYDPTNGILSGGDMLMMR